MSANEAIAERFERLTKLLELLGEDRFRVIAHQRAARVIAGLPFDVASIAADRAKLTAIEGIGPKIADKIAEFCASGTIKELDEIERQVPRGVIAMMNLSGLGPKTAAMLWKDAGVTDLAGLKRVIDDGSILNLPRMGAKSVEKLKQSLALAAEGAKRMPLGPATIIAERIMQALRGTTGIAKMTYAGSLRRGKETIGDIDILATMKEGHEPRELSERFRALPEARQILTAGDARSSIMYSTRDVTAGRCGEGDDVQGPSVQVDLRILPPASWGAALMYFTGSKEHNVRMRERALKRGLTLNEYGLYTDDDDPTPPHQRGLVPIASETEEAVFHALGLPYVPPEIREDQGELQLSRTPRLLETTDIRSELHAHTSASDGRLSIRALAEEAKRRGFHTIAVTDHSKSSVQANGLSVDRLRAHIQEVREAASHVTGISILAGSEVDILADGSLDYPDEALRELDVVIASPHAALSQDPATATERLLKAVRHPLVHILGHPTGRLLNRRAGLSPDMARVIGAAAEHGVALEINAHWLRLDLRDTHVRAAVDANCLIAVDCDVHDAEDFDNLRFGVQTARRGRVEPDRCINTWDAKVLKKWLKDKHGH